MQALPASQQPLKQPEPLRFVDVDGQVREQQFVVPQPQDFVAPQQQDFEVPQQSGFGASQRPVQFTPQQQDFAIQQQDFTAQQQEFAAQQQEFAAQQQDVAAQQQEFAAAQQQSGVAPSAPSSGESFSYAQVQFGPPVAEAAAGTTRGRSKGQRSVSRPAGRVQLVDTLTQQSVDRPVTTVDSVPAIEYPVTTIGPAVLSAHLLQNVVYIQPNGQMYKPIEDVEPVVQIPRRVVSPSSLASTDSTSTSTTTAASPTPEDEQPVVLIPQQPPPKKVQSRPRQEGRKPGRARPEITLQQHHELQHQQHLRQHHNQQSSEVEPDNFLTSLLARLQQQQEEQNLQPPEATVAAAVRPRGSQRTKGHGSRSESSKYLADRNQLQLLQFPHELKALSTAELKALEDATTQIADKPIGQKHSSSTRNGRPVSVIPPPPPPQIQPQPTTTTTAARLALGNRPVPTPVELNEQQRQFLLSQGIRNLYRVDYDQYGNALPLTYVLALDNRPKRAEQEQDQQQWRGRRSVLR